MARSSEKKFFPEMVVTAFALDRLNDDCCDVIRMFPDGVPDLFEGERFRLGDRLEILLVQREPDRRLEDSRPSEFRIEIGFCGSVFVSESV